MGCTKTSNKKGKQEHVHSSENLFHLSLLNKTQIVQKAERTEQCVVTSLLLMHRTKYVATNMAEIQTAQNHISHYVDS